MVNILTGSAFNFLAADRELECHPTVLTWLLSDFRCWHSINAITSGAPYLLWTRDELKHRPAVVANKMALGHRLDPGGDRHASVGQVNQDVLVIVRDFIALSGHFLHKVLAPCVHLYIIIYLIPVLPHFLFH